MRTLNDLQTRFAVERRLQAHPCVDVAPMECLQCLDPITRQRCRTFPFLGERIIEAGERGCKRIAGGTEQVEVAQSACPTLGQSADGHPMLLQALDSLASKGGVIRMVRVACEGQHDLTCVYSRLLFDRILPEMTEVV